VSARDAGCTEYVAARLSSLRRLAAVLCDDWQRADDLVQATLTRLYVHWGRAREASHADAYARAGLYWWSWAEPLGPMGDPAAAARNHQRAAHHPAHFPWLSGIR
jgi:hypothetical protein